MKNARNNGQKRVKNCLKWTASGLLLALMFVLVFAGTLSGAFGIENELQQNGIIQSNVASAAGVWYGNTANAEDKFSVISLEDTFRNTESKTIRINPNVDKRGGMWTTNVNQLKVNTWETDGDQGGKWYIGKNDSHTGKDFACAWFVYDLGENYKNRIYGNISISFTAKYTMWDAGGMIAIESGDNLVELPQSTSDGDSSWYDKVKNGFQNTGASCTKTAELVPNTNWIGAYKETTHDINLTHNVTGRYIRLHFATYDSGNYNEHQLNNVSVTLTRTLAYNRVYDKNGMKSDSVVDAENNLEFMANSTLTSSFYVGKDQYFTNWNTSADGSGVAMAIGASTGTSTAANTFGGVVKSNLQNGQTTTTLYAQYKEIPFVFNGTSYATYNPIIKLVVLENTENYMSSQIDGYDTSIEYKNAAGVTIPQPGAKGNYTATITVKKGGVVRGTRTVEFEVVEGDFGKIQGGTGKWGSVTNPYVISNETHLKNLSAIVNGRDALNSIVGSNNKSVTAEDVVATDKTYKDCYFVVAADLGTADARIALVPIGKDGTHYFAGTIFGGNDSDANNRTMRTISLNIQSGDENNVGLFGYVKGATATISHLTTAGTIAGGAAVGGLVGYADGVTISNCRNNATVTGAYMIGGLVGFGNNVTITSSANEGNITSKKDAAGTPSGLSKGAYVGGFVGVANGGSIAKCYNNGNISASGDNSDFLGGIAGYTTAPISYCASLKDKTIEGSNQVGGIVGKASGEYAKIEYCYFGGKINGLWNDNRAKLDFICAEKENGSTVSNSWKLSSAIQGATGNRQYTNAGHSIQVASAFTLSPSYFDGTNYIDKTWTDILTVNINAFQILGETEPGKFLALHDGSNKSTLPNKTVIDKEKNSTGSLAKTDLEVHFIVYYNADTKQNVVAELKSIKIDAAAVDYNATEQYVVDNTQLPTTVNTHYFKQSFYFDQNGGGNATLGKTNAGTYKVYSDVWIRANNTDYLVGRKESTWTIKKLKFTIGNNQFFYGQDIENAIKNQIVIKNQSNLIVPKEAYTVVFGFNDIEHNFYGSIDIDQNQKEFSVAKTIISIYDSSNTLINDNFDINGFSVIVKAGDFGVQNNGINKSNIENNPWGSENNPYIIGTRDQLVTLSNIVRGATNATNSQYTADVYKYVKGTIVSYGGAYFKLARSIASIGNITPIGTISNVFSATFDGNNKAISGLNISVAGNNVGLFGYISGATIKYLTVNGSVKGSSNVGGVVGYALNSTIENVTNNASVSSTTDKYVDYSIVRYHAHIPNSLEGVENINDRNINTKYCTSSYGAMSFVIEVPTGTFLTGFTIQNADDTNNNQKRTPKEVYIWGSNVKPTLGNNTSETPYGKSPSDSGQQGWELFYENDNIGLPSTNSTKQAYAFNQEYNYKYYWIRVVGKNKQIQFAEFEVLTQGGSVGGVVGYAKNTSIEGATNTATVNAGSNVGGIVGEFNSLGKSVSGAANSGAITSSNTAAGIVGKLTEGSISGSKNTGRVTASVATIIDGETGAFLGGIAGWANGNVNKCYNEGEITTVTSSWGHSNIVGGIVGFLVNGKTVSYCYNSGNVVGSDNIGGIVGINNGTVSYCYQDGALNDLYLGTSPSNFITSNGGAIEHCWILPGASQTGFNQDTIPNGRKLEVGQDKYKPATVGDYQTFDWQNILTVEINGFRVQESVNPNQNQFFESKKGSNSTTYLTPNKTENINQANALNRDNTASFTVTAWYDANTASDIYCAVNTIAINTSADTYNNAQLGFTRSDVTTPGTSGSVYGIVFDYKGKNPNENFVCAFDSNGNIVAGSTNPTQVDTYNTTVFVKIGDIVVGKMIAVDYAINKATLDVGWEWTDNSHKNRYDRTGNGDKVLFVYNGKEQGLMSVSLGNTALFDVTGDKLTNTDAATYTRTYTLIDTRNYKLNFTNDNTGLTESATSVEFKWTIRKNKLTVVNRWVAEDFGKDSNLYTFEYNTKHRGLLTTNYAITFFQEKATDNTKPELKQGTDYTISEHQNAISVGEYSRIVTILNNNYEVGDTNAYVDVGSSITATVGKGINVSENKLVVTYKWKIVPYSLATNIISGNVWFGGTTNLIVGNQGIANVKVGNANKGYYPLQADKKGTGVQQVLVYAQHNYAVGNFVLYVKYNNGIVAELEQGTDKEYTVGTLDIITNTFGTFNVNVVSQANPVEDTNVTARGTGNFSGDITKYYTALYSDFGWKVGKTPEDNDWGGSADNPYVISKPEHLLRLSQIVNGGTAWNSIQNTVTAGLCIAPQGTAFATDRAYSGAYFLVAADIDNIDMTGNVSTDGVYNFLPIGHRNEQSQTDMPFSGTFDGNGKKIKFVYNVNRNNFYNNSKAHSDYVGLFGYIAGYKVDAEQKYATIKNLSIESMDGNEVDDNGGIIGKDYVGGIAGYAVDSKLYNVSMMYGSWVRGENYVGGIVGYADNTWLEVEKDYGNAITYANVGGIQYVGGIVGKWIVRSEEQIGGGKDKQEYITTTLGTDVNGTQYVGGLVGWLDTSACADSVVFAPIVKGSDKNKNVVKGTEYVGALFGVVVGNGYHQSATQGKYTAIVISDQKVNNITLQTNTNAKVVGGLVGYAESVGILFETDWNTSSTTFTLDDSTSFFGGVVGVLGKNSTIEAIIVTKEGDGSYLTGSEHTILNNTALGASGKPIGSFVGGIVGYVSSQAGTYWEANTTIFGNGISLVNSGQIHATGYAGGIFGALGDLSTSVAQTFENDTNSILYNVLTTGVRSGNANTTLGIAPTVDSAYFIGAKGKLVNSASLSVTDGYVGGIAGYSGAKVRVVLRNTPQTGAIATENLNVYSGGNDIFINGSYAGGIAGYLVDNLEHELQYIVVQAKFESVNAKRVGGLVGYMGSGKVENCVVTNGGNSNVNELTDTFKGSEYVGGLVGETQNAIIINSVTTGFNLDKTTNTKGGVLGGGTNPTIESSWTFYIAKSGATYSTVSKNTYGKYILVDTDIVTTNGSSYPTFAKLCEFTGITENGTAGVIEFDVNMPRYDLNVNLKNKQLAFYDASGSDNVSTNFDSGAVNGFENKVKEIENINNVVTTKLDMASGTSMQICVVKIEFVNISNWNSTNPLYNTTNGAQKNVENAYKKPSNSSRYVVDATNNNDGTIATNPKRIYDDDGNVRYILANVYFNWQATDGTVRYVPIGSSNTDYVSDRIGTYDSEVITPGGSAENPLTISNQKEWNDFAWNVYSGANDYKDKYIKLLTSDVVIDNKAHYGTASGITPLNFGKATNKPTVTTDASDNVGYNFAGNISQGVQTVSHVTIDGVTGTKTPSFKGHFDGNGNTITINYDSGGYNRVSVFPNASNATFKNLTIDGYIYSGNSSNNSGYDIAAFVSKASGKIELYNCTNNAVIQGFRNAAGFTGYIGSHEIVIKGCVNNGSVTTYETPDNSDTYRPKYYNYGTGGIVACSNRSITIESCINNGRIVAPVNVGGIIGRVSGKHVEDNVESESKLYLYNCANTGEVYSNFKLSDEQASAFWSSKKYYGNSIWCNAGGLVGFVTKSASLHAFACYNSGYVHGVGNVVGGIVGTIGDHNGILYRTPNTRAKFPSEIVYCYNTGVVEVGYNGVNEGNGVNIWGTDGDKYCSSVVGGIVGVIANGSIKYCYNTGTIECWGGVGIKGAYHSRAGGIVGESTANSQADSSWTRYVGIINCYNVGKVNVYTNEQARYSSGLLGYMDDNAISNSHVENSFTIKDAVYKKTNNKYYDVYAEGSGADPNKSNGGSPIALVDFTAVRKSDGTVAPIGSFAETHKASLETLTNDSAYYAGTAAGYVYLPGCLPQLAVFALDMHNSLSMRSVNYGQNIYGDYVEQKAGDKYSPFIIKDGIDLLGLQALVDLGYTFEGKFVEFANETNNIKNDGTNEPMISSTINMPLHQNNTQKIESSEGAYKSSTLDGNFTQTGKNYHLFAIGAVCSDGINTSANSAYTTWLSRNYYYKQDSQTMAQGATFATVNFLPIGRNGKVFKGSISGKQENNANTVINNLRITSGQTTGGAYGGLFGHIDNAYIGYIEVGGESNIWAYSSDNQQIAATGAIAGYVTGDSVIEHCAVSGTTAIGAYGKNDDTPIASDITYAGGIVGLANPKKGTQYEAGISAIIKDCTVNISTTTGDRAAFAGIIQACKSNIGGVLGYVGGDAGANGKGNSVRIEGCEVQKAAIQVASSAKTSSHIGGVLGYVSDYVAAFITGCKVGNGADTVTIKGEHSLGGIAGGMSNAKGGYIDSCTVGANTTIERIDQGGGNISENPKHGTAIGGLVGFTEDSTDTTSPLTTTFSGTSAFSGKINVTVGTTNPGEHGDKKPVGNVGGIVGDMGSGANFASGSDVEVRGNINVTLAAANVGGVAGRTSNATFIGKFDVSPTMNTSAAENVGGFIGKNVGTVYILADTTERIVDGKLNGTNIIIGGTIKGTSEVGGFIGVNNSGSSLNIGSNVANAKPYKSGTLSITIENGTITGGDNVGGIVGKNEGADGGASYASIDIVKGTITQQGTINGANNVGGIIGLNDGLLTTGGGEADTSIGGTTLDENQIGLIKNLSITNNGNVTGSGNYVGGVVGKLDSPATLRTEDSGKGAIAGTFTNNGTVDGNSFVGGSLGFVGKNVTITAKNNVATLFVNDGEVNATGYFVGGSIGALVGKIQGENSSVAVKFENKKKVNATGFVGGSIGVLAGPVSYAQFVNSSGDLTIAAVNSVGGSVGYIGVPSPLSDELVGFTAHQIDINNTHFEASGNLKANPSQDAINAAKKDKEDNGWGGVGGAIGVMGAAINSWKDNTYYANGNVKANVIEDGIETGIYNVGGIVGLINAGNITISNMLAYRTTVTGGKNVGGIVGATTGAKTVINSAYAIEGTFSATSATKGAGDNVGGIIGLAKDDTDASTSYWVKGYANSDIATYDVKDLSKLGFTTGKATTGWFFLYANDATGANGLGIINTNHQGGGEIELKYWKRIANAYTAQERADGDDKKTIAPPSGIVSGGQPQHATLYATATAAEVTEKGYYMYTATSNNDVKPSVIYDNGVYYISVKTNVINAEDEKVQAQNVAVFYRSVSSSKEALIYNGYLRNAIIGLDGVDLYENPIGDNETPTINGYKGQYIFTATTTIKNDDGSTTEVNEAQSDPNTYVSIVKIYYVDDNSKARLVGGNTGLGWKISERELAVAFEHTTNRTYGTGTEDNTTDMTVTIDNIAPKRGVTVPIRIVVSYGAQEDSRVIFTWDGTKFNGADENIKLTSIPMTQSGTLSDKDKESTSETIEDEATYQLVVKLFFKQAKSYTITVLDSSQKARYTFKKNGGSASAEVSDEFTVLPAELRLVSSYATSSAYDGTYKGKEWLVTGFKYNDGILQFAEFGPSFNIKYKNGDVTTKAMTADNMTTGVDFNGPRVSVAGPSNGNLTISLANAINKGEYYLTFGKIAAGNYTLKIEDYLFSIVEIQIEISCDDNGKSKIYDGNAKDVKFTFKASAPAGVTFDGISEYKTFISKFFKINNQTIETNSLKLVDNKTITLTLQTEKDAATYKFVFGKGEKYDDHIKNCALKPATLPTYTYTITKRSITLSTTPTSTKTYIYNTEHQGLSQVKLNGESGDVGIVSGDTVMVKVSVPGGDPSSKTLSFDNQTLEVTAGISTIDANQYVASFDLDDASSKKNYTLSATNVSWKIDKYKIMIGEFEIGAEKTYNAEAEVPKINVTNSEVSGNGTTFNYGTDTFTLEYAVSYNNQTYASNNLVNAGTYKIKIGTSNGKIHAKHSDGNDASNNYEFGNSSTEHQYVINPCEIKIGWEKKTFVYNASNWKLNVASIEINNKTKTVTNNRVQTGLGNDTLTFSRGGGGIDVGSYTTEVTSYSVSVEPNHGVRPIAGNYKIVSGATSDKFAITPSKLKIFYAGGTTSKVYDAGFGISGKPFVFNTQSQNGGAHGTSELFDISYVYKDKNVGNDKEVVFTYVLKQNANYEYVGTGTESQNKGQITPAHIKVALDKLRSGKATRTFTNDERYGGNGASGNNHSQIYRAGEGFSVSGVLGNDNIVVTASYREALDSRNGTGNSFDLSKYVNDVEKNENTFTKVASGTYYKTLVFNLTGDDAANYTFNVYRGENKFGENDSTASASQNITVYDSRDKASGHQNANGAEQIKIEITVKSVRVEYSNTAQSYANDDNTYNKDWLRVTGTNKDMQGAGAEIVVTNGWMYKDGKDRPADSTDPKREYYGYTTIRGSQNSERLGAAVSKVNGMDLNYRLSNQPVLTIAYFVADGGEYKIDSLARLLIASFYYTAHQSPGDLEIVKIVSSGYQWVTVVSNDKYEKNEEIPAGFETWDAYFAKLKDDGYEVFLNVEEIKDGDVTIPANTWGYYQSTSNTDAALPTSYKLTKDISGKFTQSDIAILNTFFTVTTVGDDGHITQTEYTWSGANSDYLKNVLSAAVDKVATINGSLFVSQKAEGAAAITGFDGTFDGNGYVIEYLNIMGYDKENVGLFDIIGANGIVKNLHLRNITINANQGNVGGIAGSIAAAEGDADAAKNVTNVSFHGKITASGGTVGGLFGTSARAIDGAIVLGEISASGASAGGVVGTATADLTKVVSMMQITASGGTVGAFTSNDAHVGENCTHMTNAVWKSGTGFVNVKDKNVGYNALMSGSNSLYANAASALDPTYDVINEEFADSGQNVNPRQSKRLRDMVSVYLLMYSLSANGDKYTISSSSWLVGTADGTDNNKIVIANKQNVSLLRELRFAAFVLKANVSIYIASTFSGAFYGSVISAANESGVSYDYKITCNKQMFEAYAPTTQAWLEVKP